MITKSSNNNSNSKTVAATAAVITIKINFMHHSPSEANRSKARQEILQFLWNMKVHYLVYNSPTPVPVLSYINLVHTFPSYFFQFHYNITLPSMPKSPKWYFPSGFPIKTLQAFFSLLYMPHVPSLSSSWIWTPLQYTTMSVNHEAYHDVQFSLASHHFLPLRSKHLPQNPFLKCPQPMFFLYSERPSFTPV